MDGSFLTFKLFMNFRTTRWLFSSLAQHFFSLLYRRGGGGDGGVEVLVSVGNFCNALHGRSKKVKVKDNCLICSVRGFVCVFGGKKKKKKVCSGSLVFHADTLKGPEEIPCPPPPQER